MRADSLTQRMITAAAPLWVLKEKKKNEIITREKSVTVSKSVGILLSLYQQLDSVVIVQV